MCDNGCVDHMCNPFLEMIPLKSTAVLLLLLFFAPAAASVSCFFCVNQ